MKKQFLFASIVATAMLAGCTKHEEPNLPLETGDQIMANARDLSIESQGDKVDTRAPYIGAIGANNGLTAFVVSKRTTEADYAAKFYSKGEMIFTDPGVAEVNSIAYIKDATGITFEGVSSLPAGVVKLNIFAVSPAHTASADNFVENSTKTKLKTPTVKWTVEATGVKGTITGIEDVMAAPAVEIGKTATKFATFAFKHQLVLAYVFTRAEDKDAAGAWGKIKSITFSALDGTQKFKSDVTIPAATGVATYATDKATWDLFKKYTHDKYEKQKDTLSYKGATTFDTIAYSILTPFTAKGTTGPGDIELTVVTNNGATEADFGNAANDVSTKVPIKLGTAYAAASGMVGKKLNIKLTFKASAIKGVASVTSWADGGEGNADVQ